MQCLVALFVSLFFVFGTACSDGDVVPEHENWQDDVSLASEVRINKIIDANDLNEGLSASNNTVLLNIYLTENGPISWEDLKSSVTQAKRIYADAGVQLKIGKVLMLSIPDVWQTLDKGTIQKPTTEGLRERDFYAFMEELERGISQRTQDIFEAIIATNGELYESQTSGDMLHMISLHHVPLAFYDLQNMEWVERTVPTGGLSFPTYFYGERMPNHLRGVFTMSSAGRSRTLAHELGHKLINVSHEGIGVCPSFEANGDDLMLYYDGERIPRGNTGRFHHERLQLSPFIFTEQNQTIVHPNRYADFGVYNDSLYGEFIMDPLCEQ